MSARPDPLVSVMNRLQKVEAIIDESDTHWHLDMSYAERLPRTYHIPKDQLTELCETPAEAERLIREWYAKKEWMKEAADDKVGQLQRPPVYEQHRSPGTNCDQDLLPGMREHWGKVQRCDSHEKPFNVCMGCRVAHRAQNEHPYFDRKAMMAHGARVPICEDCAEKSKKEYGMAYVGCACDTGWTCMRCRDAELAGLSSVRFVGLVQFEGRCPTCLDVKKGRASDVMLCLKCRGVRTYWGFREVELKEMAGDG